MTVENQTTKVTANGNGAATSFSFSPIVIYASSNLQVTKVSTAGAETLLAETTDYTISVSEYPGTGSVVYPVSGSPLASGEKLIMKRVLPIEQKVDLENQGGYFPEVQETALDKLTMIALQQKEELDRTLKVRISSGSTPSDTDLENLETVASIAADVTTLADMSSDLETIADLSADITAVVANEADISLVADNLGSIAAKANVDLSNVDATTGRSALGAAKSGSNSDITALSAISSVLGGAVSGTRNLLDNGSFRVSELGSSAAYPLTGSTEPIINRWHVLLGHTNYSILRESNGLGGYSLHVETTDSTANAGVHRVASIVPSERCNLVPNQVVTFTFKLRTGGGWNETIDALIVSGNGTNQSALSLESGTWTGSTSVSSVSVSANPTSWTEYTCSGTLGGSVNQLAAKFQWNDPAVDGAWFEITDVDLRIGTGRGTFTEDRPVILEEILARHYRPWFKSTNTVYPLGSGGANSSTEAIVFVPFGIPTRIPPTAVVVSSPGDFAISHGGADFTCTSLTFMAASEQGALLQAGVASGMTGGGSAILYGQNSNARLTFTGAEF